MKATVKLNKIMRVMKIVESFDDVKDLTHIVELITEQKLKLWAKKKPCLLYTSPSPRDRQKSRMPSSA